MGPNPRTGVLIRKGGQDREAHQEKTAICTPRREAQRNQPCRHLDPGPPAPRTDRKHISVVEAARLVVLLAAPAN